MEQIQNSCLGAVRRAQLPLRPYCKRAARPAQRPLAEVILTPVLKYDFDFRLLQVWQRGIVYNQASCICPRKAEATTGAKMKMP